MTKEEQILLEKIYIERFNHEMDYLTKETANNMYWLRGFLLHPDTSRAWFGEEETFHSIYPDLCDDTIPPMEIVKYHHVPAFEYHLQQMSLLPTVSEIIAYYGRYV